MECIESPLRVLVLFIRALRTDKNQGMTRGVSY